MTLRLPAFVTFTGLDERTDLARALDLSSRYPIEWGVLLSPAHTGETPRYPSERVLGAISASGLRLSAHLCGGHSHVIMDWRAPRLPVDLERFSRVQVNHRWPEERRIVDALPGVRCIAQTRGSFVRPMSTIDWLFDRSGGRGVTCETWPVAVSDVFCGYAGGIGPKNVARVLASINATHPYWIDMESGVRTDDWLDLDKCEAVCRAVFSDHEAK